MRESAKNKLSQCLINENCKKNLQKELKSTYEKFKREVEYNIEGGNSFSDKYKYLKETELFFKEIIDGYFKTSHIQLELNFFEKENTKKNKSIKLAINE